MGKRQKKRKKEENEKNLEPLIFTHDYLGELVRLRSRKLILIYNRQSGRRKTFSTRISVPTAKNVVDNFCSTLKHHSNLVRYSDISLLNIFEFRSILYSDIDYTFHFCILVCDK